MLFLLRLSTRYAYFFITSETLADKVFRRKMSKHILFLDIIFITHMYLVLHQRKVIKFPILFRQYLERPGTDGLRM